MVKGIRRKILKWFVIFTYPVLLVLFIAMGIILYVKSTEYNRLQDTFSQAQGQLNKENENKEITIADLQENFEELVKTVDTLTAENKNLKAELTRNRENGIGRISGKVFPFISEQSGSFNQYQRVCAEGVGNSSLQYCGTVSALKQDYTLYLPAGKYNVYAELFPNANNQRAYYTQGVACTLQQYGETGCDENDNTPLAVEVVINTEKTGINPVAWGEYKTAQ